MTIQKFARMMIAKKKKKFLKESKNSIIIQKYARCYLAKKFKHYLKKTKNSIIIQVKIHIFFILKSLINFFRHFGKCTHHAKNF